MNTESEPRFSPPDLLRLGESIAVLPVIHGSGQFALTVRRWMLEQDFDCVAVPLPDSFREPTEAAILELPRPSIVIQRPLGQNSAVRAMSRISILFKAIRTRKTSAMWISTRIRPATFPSIRVSRSSWRFGRRWESTFPAPTSTWKPIRFLPFSSVMPDPFAVRKVSAERFAAALLPSLPRPPDRQTRAANRLHGRSPGGAGKALRSHSVRDQHLMHWPWIREAYTELFSASQASNKSESSSEVEIPDS